MSGAFPRTLGSFASDGYRRSAVWTAVALLVLGAWAAWFFAAPITVYEVSSAARLEVDRALHPLSAPADGVVISSSLSLDRPVRAGDVLVALESRSERLQLEDKRESERQARLGRLKGELSRMDGQAASSRAASERLENDIQRRLVRAPADGRVVEVAPMQAGTFLTAGDRIGAVLASGRLKLIASFPAAGALGRVRPGQQARLRLAGFPWMQYGTVPATVASVASEVRDGGIRVELDVFPDPASGIPLQHGLPGTVEVEVERLTPAALALRSLGRRLSPVARETVVLLPAQ